MPGTAELRCRGQALTHDDDSDENIKHGSCGTTRHWHVTTAPRTALGSGQQGGDPSPATALNSLWKSKAAKCGIIQTKEKASISFSTRGHGGELSQLRGPAELRCHGGHQDTPGLLRSGVVLEISFLISYIGLQVKKLRKINVPF